MVWNGQVAFSVLSQHISKHDKTWNNCALSLSLAAIQEHFCVSYNNKYCVLKSKQVASIRGGKDS